MPTAAEIKWELNRQKSEYATGIRSFEAVNWDKLLPIQRFYLQSEPDIFVYVFEDGSFRVSDEKIFELPDLVLELIAGLRTFIEPFHPDFFQHLDSFDQRDSDANRISRLEQILESISDGIEEMPELKQELITIGKMLERGEDVREYCTQKNFDCEY